MNTAQRTAELLNKMLEVDRETCERMLLRRHDWKHPDSAVPELLVGDDGVCALGVINSILSCCNQHLVAARFDGSTLMGFCTIDRAAKVIQ